MHLIENLIEITHVSLDHVKYLRFVRDEKAASSIPGVAVWLIYLTSVTRALFSCGSQFELNSENPVYEDVDGMKQCK